MVLPNPLLVAQDDQDSDASSADDDAEAKRGSDVSDNDEEEGEEGLGPFTSAFLLLRRNRQLAKVVLASGLQQAAAAVSDTFIISVLAGSIWGSRMAMMNSMFGIAINIVASVAGGPFGRFSDAVDRRIAAAVFGLGSFFPAWAVIFFGPTETGLMVIMYMKVVGSVGTAANVPMALANDVTDLKDREVGTGAFFAGTNMLNVTLNGLPVLLFLVFEVFPSSWEGMLFYQVTICVAYFVTLASIDVSNSKDSDFGETGRADTRSTLGSPRKRRKRERAHHAFCGCACCGGHGGEVEAGDASDRSTNTATGGSADHCGGSLGPLKLIFTHRRLRRVCAAAFLLSFSGSVILSVSGQFHFQSLGLLPYGTVHELQLVAAIGMLPGQLLVLPGFLLTGYLAKAKGTLRLLRTLIPITALLKLFGVFLALVSKLWFLPLVVTAESYTGLAMVPLMRLVGAVAPPGRVGEAMSAVGVSMQVAGFVGNFFVVCMHPVLHRFHVETQLWMYYPFCATLHLMAILPVWGSPSKSGWGVESGKGEDKVMAVLRAKDAGAKWRATAKAKSQARREASPSSRQDMMLAVSTSSSIAATTEASPATAPTC